MPGGERVADLGGHRGQLHHRLGDPATGVGLDLAAHGRKLLLGGVRAEDDSVAARALHRLDDQFVDAVEDLLAFLVEPAAQGVDIGQQRLLAEVVIDDGGHVGVDQLVVADAVADRAGDHHVARPRSIDDAGHPEYRVGAELHGIEVVVVDAPVDHIDLTVALGGAHVDNVVAAEKVRPLDEFHTHLPGEQRVLEVRGVERSGGEHHHRGIGLVGRRGVAQGPQQMRGVVVDRAHPVSAEQVREHPRHHPTVLHDVGDPRRGAQIVFEHPEGALRITDDVDAGDVDAHAVGRVDADGFAVEVLTGGHQPARDDAVAQDLLVAIDIVEELLQCPDPLSDAAFELRPLGGRDDPGHQIQREGPLLLAGQRKGDALIDEGPPQRIRASTQFVGTGGSELGVNPLVGGPDAALAVEHFVESGAIRAQVAVAPEDVMRVRHDGLGRRGSSLRA